MKLIVSLLSLLAAAKATASSSSTSSSIETLQRSLQANGDGNNARDRDPLTNDSLRQAVALWMGSDHNKAEVTALLGPIQQWDTSRVTDMAALFRGVTDLRDEDLSQWDTGRVTDMADLFNGATNYRGVPTLEEWNTERVTSMARMFKGASSIDDMDLGMLNTEQVTDMTSVFQDATFFKGNGLREWNVDKVQFFNYFLSRATNANPTIGNWNTQSAEFMDGMFEYAVSFNQNISSWDMTNLVSAQGMLEGTSQFAQKLCWNTLPDDANVNNLFCDSHSAARLDPCCTSAEVIDAACCSDSGVCDTYCPALDGSVALEDGDTVEVSNDPPAAGDGEDDLQEQDAGVDDDAGLSGGNNGADVLTISISSNNNDPDEENENENGVDMDIDQPTANTTNGTVNANANSDGPEPEPSTGSTLVDVQSENFDENENAWQQYVWLRILVFVAALLLLGNCFLYYLGYQHRRNMNRRQRDQLIAASNKDANVWDEDIPQQPGGTSLVKGKMSEDDEMTAVNTVQTKPTDDSAGP